MSHFSDISVTSAGLLPAVVRQMGLFCPEALTEDDCCQVGPAKLKCHACVPGLDPWSASTNPDCLLSTPPAPPVHRYVTCVRLLITCCPSELSHVMVVCTAVAVSSHFLLIRHYVNWLFPPYLHHKVNACQSVKRTEYTQYIHNSMYIIYWKDWGNRLGPFSEQLISLRLFRRGMPFPWKQLGN